MAKTKDTTASKPKVVKIKRFQIGLNVLLQVAIFLGIVLMLNYISFRHFKRWDFSRNQKYALSSQTKNLLENLKKPVRGVVFFSSASEIAGDLQSLLREYEFASDRKFTVETVDPYRNLTRAQDLQSKYKFGPSENILILDYEERNKFVNAADMADFEMPDQMAMMMGGAQPRLKAFKGEQAITSALLELTEGKPNKVYVLSGHGELDLKAEELKVFNESLKRQNIQADMLNLLNVDKIPEDARAVIINAPKYDLSELELKLLTDFWQKNGRIFAVLNSMANTPRLDEWLAQQGLSPQRNRIYRIGSFMAMAEGGAPSIQNRATPNAVFEVMDSGTKITKDLAGLSKQLLGPTQSLLPDRTKEKTDKLRIVPLLQAVEGSWGETDPVIGDQRVFFDPKKDHIGPLAIAAAVEKGAVEDARVKVETSRLVVVGNGEMLTNNGYRQSEGAAMDFSVNSLNWLLDREELIGIAPKEKKNEALRLDEKQLGNIALTIMGLIPGLVAIIGIANWWSRRS
jgi:hypothetical protein